MGMSDERIEIGGVIQLFLILNRVGWDRTEVVFHHRKEGGQPAVHVIAFYKDTFQQLAKEILSTTEPPLRALPVNFTIGGIRGMLRCRNNTREQAGDQK